MRFAYLTHEDVPNTLYHYTSLEALVSIVQSKRLRASAIRFLNDTSEAMRLKEDVVGILRKRASSSEDQEILKTLIDALDPGPKQSLFVASLSEKSDLLSQWRAYCPSGRGVSIGFSSDSLGEQWIANPRGDKPFFLGAPLQKVRYYESAHQSELEQMIDRLLETERKHNGGKPSKFPNFNVLAIVAPLFKDAKFEEGELDEITRIAADKIIEREGNPEPRLHLPGSAIATLGIPSLTLYQAWSVRGGMRMAQSRVEGHQNHAGSAISAWEVDADPVRGDHARCDKARGGLCSERRLLYKRGHCRSDAYTRAYLGSAAVTF
jgi:Protein of unknown function (DUF2971)